ncbi:Cellulose biosynthesis protein BcsQ [Haladaptatus litoreus]|uniref:Cellulose biosynthesis protein BcsQ n=1 Tax=Haladaptatus litoreus TaxID=553468 RepID=A0A1N7D1D6_9EURY|nr:ParA family protein [Haladaptatus litoreus]SIR69524.1 Cellulose biosynthesis protein BcsQ [Haladaptatus litoreus]
MIPYTVWSEAGGVGKTTLSLNLAAAHARRGQRVLAIDMDPQEGGLTHHLGAGENRADATVDNLVRHMVERPKGEFADLVVTVDENLDLVPGHNMLGSLEQNLTRAAEMEQSMHDANYRWPKEKQLRRVLSDAGVPSDYDVLIIDPPATVGQHIYNSIYATSNLLIPAELSAKGEQSVEGLRDVVNNIEETLGDIEVGVLGVVPNKVSDTNVQQSVFTSLEEQDLPIAPVSIRERGSMLGEAWQNQVSIFELAESDEFRDLRDYETGTLEKFDELAASISEQFATPEGVA